MYDTCTDFVIQISTSASVADMGGKNAGTSPSPLVAEFQQCLKPGTEIGLVFPGYVAITSVLWLSGPTEDNSVRAGVRMVGISAGPSEHLQPAPSPQTQEAVSPA
jgi:hypothetical protein